MRLAVVATAWRGVCAILIAAFGAGPAGAVAKIDRIEVDVTSDPVVRFRSQDAFGASLDGGERGEILPIYSPHNIGLMRAAGLPRVSYRLRTELGIEAWHWTDQGRWSDAEGYWVPLGWSRDGPIKTQSRVDVPRASDTLDPGPTTIAGVAWAQHRGVAKVEVRVDEEAWREATLATEVSDDTWRQWRIDWDAPSGRHKIQVRATDKTGATQVEEVMSPPPDGATGYHTRRITVR